MPSIFSDELARLRERARLLESRIAHGVWTWADREKLAQIRREIHDLEYAMGKWKGAAHA